MGHDCKVAIIINTSSSVNWTQLIHHNKSIFKDHLQFMSCAGLRRYLEPGFNKVNWKDSQVGSGQIVYEKKNRVVGHFQTFDTSSVF